MSYILDLGAALFDYMKRIFFFFIEKFLDLNIVEKIVVFLVVPAFFAIALPMARYYIFESWFYINNPLAVYLIGIVFLMLGLAYAPALASFVIRMLVNAWYLFWVFYVHCSGELSRAPYELMPGYYLNIAVPALFMGFSIVSFVLFRGER